MTYKEAHLNLDELKDYIHDGEWFTPVIVPTLFEDYLNFLSDLKDKKDINVKDYSSNNDFAVIGLMKKAYSTL